MSSRYARIVFLIFPITLFSASLLASITMYSYAQVTTGTFLGFVTDSSGAVIAGAKVTATNEATNLTRNVNTNSSGEYVIALLPVGRYTLTVEAPNFKRHVAKGVALELDQKVKIDVRLEVGQLTEVVTSDVANSAPLIRTETAEASEVIENKRIVELP